MQEIEAKFYVRDLKATEMCIQELGAYLIQPRVLETNIRFDLPGARLRSEGRVLRLRQDMETRLTYKGPGISDQGIVNRTEIEFTVEDFEKAKLFLEALGYQKLLTYEKYRSTYELEICHIMLDELPYGNFVEIEGEAIDAIHETASKLSLNLEVAIAESYSSLFERVRQSMGLTFADLTFENFKGIHTTVGDLSVYAADD